MPEKQLTPRDEFNSSIRPHYQQTHVPQCKRCMKFHPWGNSVMHVHHIVALVFGGTNAENNLITLCDECHNEWHTRMEERLVNFDEWMQSTPAWVYAAVGKLRDKEQRINFDEIDEWWPYMREERMVKQPYKTAEYRRYTEEHCDEWADW